MHKCETAIIEERLEVDPVYLKDEVVWCINAVPQHAGLCAYVRHKPSLHIHLKIL